MAKALVLRGLESVLLGLQTAPDGLDREIVVDITGKILRRAWLSTGASNVRSLYGIISLARDATSATSEGRHLKEGWFSSNAGNFMGGIEWEGEVPPEKPSGSMSIIFSVSNLTGADGTYTIGYSWSELEENDRPT